MVWLYLFTHSIAVVVVNPAITFIYGECETYLSHKVMPLIHGNSEACP